MNNDLISRSALLGGLRAPLDYLVFMREKFYGNTELRDAIKGI